MKKNTALLFLSIFFTSHMAIASELTLTAKDGFKLTADYLSPTTGSNRAVLMLHQCNQDRKMYSELAESLANTGFHVLNLDFRGFGESIDNKTNVNIAPTLPEAERRPYMASIMAHYPSDTEIAYQALLKRTGPKAKLGIIGASCGGWQARTVVHNHPIETVIFFSAPIFHNDNPESIEEFKSSVTELPALFITAEKDFVYDVTTQASKWNTNPHSKLLTFKGDAHGLPLFEQEQGLAKTMLEWFNEYVTP